MVQTYVRNDFYLATAADIVADPSAPNAFRRRYYGRKRVDLEQWIDQEAEVAEDQRKLKKTQNNNLQADSFRVCKVSSKVIIYK